MIFDFAYIYLRKMKSKQNNSNNAKRVDVFIQCGKI